MRSSQGGPDPFLFLQFAISFARIECHYFVHAGFFQEDGQLINNANILKDIPGTIVQGRYDLVCPTKVRGRKKEGRRAWVLTGMVGGLDGLGSAQSGSSF